MAKVKGNIFDRECAEFPLAKLIMDSISNGGIEFLTGSFFDGALPCTIVVATGADCARETAVLMDQAKAAIGAPTVTPTAPEIPTDAVPDTN